MNESERELIRAWKRNQEAVIDEDFLAARRALMAAKLRTYFETLGGVTVAY